MCVHNEIAIQMSSSEACTIVYRFLTKPIPEADTNFKCILRGTQSFQWSGASNIISRLCACFDRTPYHYSTGPEGVLCSTYYLWDYFLASSHSLLRATCHTRYFLECISAHTGDAARMYGLAVAGDIRNPATMLVLHASDLLDTFPKAAALVALLSLSFPCPERSSIPQAAYPATSCSTL